MSVAPARRLVVVHAGLSQPSSTGLLAHRLATATSDALLERGAQAQVETIDLRDHAQALAAALASGFPTGTLRQAMEAVAAADAVIAVTPVYQASYSGLFKLFFDTLRDGELRGTPVLMAATAGTARHSLVLEHAMRLMFAHLKAITVPTAVFAASEDWGVTGSSEVDRGLATRVEVAAGELADLVTGRVADRVRTDDFTVDVSFEDLLRGS